MTYTNFTTWKTEPVDDAPEISVVIPAYNEAERIVPTIATVAAHLARTVGSFEIIVSDDGSTDGTVAVVRLLGLRNVRVLDPGFNTGKGGAVAAGVLAATGRYILVTDADLSTPIAHVDEMLETARKGSAVVIGSRCIDGAMEQNRSLVRRACSATLRWLTTNVLGSDFSDTQCGFKLFERDAGQQIFSAMESTDFSFDLEALWLANEFGHEVAEVAVTWFDAPGSTVCPHRVVGSFITQLVKLRWKSMRSAGPAPKVKKFGVVTALPPSPTTLNEYGFHLTRHLANVEGIGEVVALHEDGAATVPNGVTGVESWRFNSFRTPFRLIREARRQQLDAALFNIHFTAFGTNKIAAGLGLLTPALMRLAGIPTVVMLHNLVDTVDLEAAGFGSHSTVERLLRAIGTFLTTVILRSDRVVTTMPNYVDILRDRYEADNVYLTPHGNFDTTPFIGSEPSDGTRRILAFGKFGTYKRLEGLIEAYRALIAEPGFDDVELIVGGTDSPNAAGYLAEMEALAADLPGVKFLGYVEEEDVEALFESSSVVVFPYTSTTGSSGPLHQAGAFGKPVIVPEVGDFVGLLADEGFVGVSFDPTSSTSLGRALETVLSDAELRARHGATNHAAANSLPLADIASWHAHHLCAASA